MEKEKKNVPALDKCFRIMNLLADEGVPVSSAEIAKRLDLPKSTVHGLLGTLINHSVLKKGADQKYFFGPHIMYWANGFLASQDIITIFHQEIEKIEGLDKYTLTISVREKEEVIYLACRNAEIPLGFFFRPGMKLPAAFTSTGKAMLSTLPDDKIAEIFSENWPKPMTRYSVTRLDSLLQEMCAVRKNGFSVDNGQIKEGMYCIGKAVCDLGGTGCAGISVSLVREEFSEDAVRHISRDLALLVKNIETQMGYPDGTAKRSSLSLS